MEIAEMKIDDIEKRMSEINEALTDENADIDALNAEVDALIEQRGAIETRANNKRDLLAKIAAGAGTTIDTKEERENNVNDIEKREALYDALAESIKGKATPEQRALLTTNASGTVSVATIVDGYIWTDWEKSPILSRVRRTFIRGNYKVNYESSATGAVLHAEGTTKPAEEQLVLGTVEFIGEYLKKWIKVTDNVLALRGKDFLDYLFNEFGHQLAKGIEGLILEDIAESELSAKVTHALDGDAVLAGLAKLSDEATNPVVIMAKSTYAKIRAIRTTAGARLEDPFEGLEVLFNNMLAPAEGNEAILVGDLDGVIVNFPDGDDFKYIVDETSLAEDDWVKIVGKIMVAAHLVRPNGFAVVSAA